ncbi:hypothetical protein [Miniphocaeibacter massiliensis]|uniref:hypothetical protein n=1 Tax=Miniphocaeibacter massiliensis TaxID=2041841 RepID=UPI000C1C642F|nr:hypothetical protein [Miniphocaeibacter massiliensis]
MKKSKTRKKQKNSRRSRKNKVEKIEKVEVKKTRNALEKRSYKNTFDNLIVNEKFVQRRFYDDEGNAKIDIDYFHSGSMEFPHKHIWKNDVRSSTEFIEEGDEYMSDYTFDNFKEDLVMGREMEFKFNGAGFSIINIPDENSVDEAVWYFSILSNVDVGVVICDFEDRERLLKFVDELYIDGIALKDIINGELHTELYIM